MIWVILGVLALWILVKDAASSTVTTPKPTTYGPEHRALREQVRRRINRHGGTCAERVCVKPNRDIPVAGDFHLAHDHINGGYLGPAHVECNLQERLRRKRTPVRPAPRFLQESAPVAAAPIAPPIAPTVEPTVVEPSPDQKYQGLSGFVPVTRWEHDQVAAIERRRDERIAAIRRSKTC